MVLTLNIDQIALTTRDWICKVQIVEIGRPRESPDKKCRFQNLILEDEQVSSLHLISSIFSFFNIYLIWKFLFYFTLSKQFNLSSNLYNSYFQECQIKAVLYADEIEQYAEMLKLMNTYLISTARVKISQTSHGKPIHKFYWVLDKETVIEHITPSNGVENPLPPPTKLNITTFDRIPHMMFDSAVEIGISTLLTFTTVKYTCLLIHTLTTFHSLLYTQIYWQSFSVVVLKNTQVAVIINVEKLSFVTISKPILPYIFPFNENILNN